MGAFPIKRFWAPDPKDYDVIDWALEVTGTKDIKFRPLMLFQRSAPACLDLWPLPETRKSSS